MTKEQLKPELIKFYEYYLTDGLMNLKGRKIGLENFINNYLSIIKEPEESNSVIKDIEDRRFRNALDAKNIDDYNSVCLLENEDIFLQSLLTKLKETE